MSLFETTSRPEEGGAASVSGQSSFTVGQLAELIKKVLGVAFERSLWVEGEIRNLSRARSGHVYFDLVEPDLENLSGGQKGNQLKASMGVALFRYQKEQVDQTLQQHGNLEMDDGVRVRIQADLDFWAPRGQLRLKMTGIDPNFTLGELEAERLRLLQQLSDEGLLAKNRAVPFPVAPLRIGLVTSDGSAAHRDFCDELETSGLAWEVLLADTPVQGIDAPPRIGSAIRAVGRSGVDVIALIRGGGSRTDLAAFDSEIVARAIADSPVPVVTGIGHETDQSVADEVAHEAQKTPTACAAFIVDVALRHLYVAEEAWEQIVTRANRVLSATSERLSNETRSATRAIESHLAAAQMLLHRHGEKIRSSARSRSFQETRRLDQYAGTIRYRAPAVIANQRQSVEQAKAAIIWAKRIPKAAAKELSNLDSRVRLLDPQSILARGWSITRHQGQVVRDPSALSVGDELITTLSGGDLASTVGPSQQSTGGSPAAQHREEPDSTSRTHN